MTPPLPPTNPYPELQKYIQDDLHLSTPPSPPPRRKVAVSTCRTFSGVNTSSSRKKERCSSRASMWFDFAASSSSFPSKFHPYLPHRYRQKWNAGSSERTARTAWKSALRLPIFRAATSTRSYPSTMILVLMCRNGRRYARAAGTAI